MTSTRKQSLGSPPYKDLTIVIQAGGESKRMGTLHAPTKALVPFLGEPLVVRIAKRLSYLTNEIVITIQNDFLKDFEQAFLHWDKPTKIRFAVDAYHERGALPGIYTAFLASQTAYTALVACDTPFVAPRLIEEEYHFIQRKSADACIVRTQDFFYEPMQAVYATKPCLQAVSHALFSGEKRAASWIPNVHTLYFSNEALSHIPSHKFAFFNANTPEEILHGEYIARKLSE